MIAIDAINGMTPVEVVDFRIDEYDAATALAREYPEYRAIARGIVDDAKETDRYNRYATETGKPMVSTISEMVAAIKYPSELADYIKFAAMQDELDDLEIVEANKLISGLEDLAARRRYYNAWKANMEALLG